MGLAIALKKLARRRRPLMLDTAQSARIQELRENIAHLPALPDAQDESAAASEWMDNRRRLRHLLASDDPRRFLEWDVINNTMFLGSAPWVRIELGELKGTPDWNQQWKPVLREDAAGCPPRCRWRMSSSGGLIHHAYQIFRTQEMLGKKLNQFSRIVEFGGGYGGFARLVWRLGFRGHYAIFDLPEFSALQRYFLQSVGVPLVEDAQSAGVHCITQMDHLIAEAAGGTGLFLGYWSISETPLDFRRQVLTTVAPVGNFLIGYQHQFGEADNLDFFRQWTATQSQCQWKDAPVGHLPDGRYLAGLRS